MLMKFCKRFMWGVLFALLLSFITITTSQAKTLSNEVGPPSDCLECHEDTVIAWQESDHAQALNNAAFQHDWQEQGEPRDCLRCHTTGFDSATSDFVEEGVACSSCHYLGPNSPNHPGQVMFTKYSAETCGECHLETFADWQVSAHGESDMTCVNCHNPHTNTIKQEDVGMLCQTCHTNEGHFYNMTAHADEGLLCTDCHLRVSDTPLGEGHAQRHHTFIVDLETCNECHGQDMHYPSESEAESGMGLVDSNTGDSGLSFLTDPQLVGLNPSPNSPFNLALLAAVIGLAFGFVGSPLFERWFRKVKGEVS
jgi:hypothetical protein